MIDIIALIGGSMAGRLTRAQVAEKLGVNPATILRWEKRGISPVMPKRLVRTRQLIYSEDDIPKYQAWMDQTEAATFKAASG